MPGSIKDGENEEWFVFFLGKKVKREEHKTERNDHGARTGESEKEGWTAKEQEESGDKRFDLFFFKDLEKDAEKNQRV